MDRSPFTATVTGAAPVTGQAVEGGACTPNLAGETVVIYDASGKRKLGSAVQPSRGEVLPSDFGDMAGWCFHATRVAQVPGGEGMYKVQVGGGNLVTVEEEQLRASADEQRQVMKR
ncbi:hypothetical protein ACQF36_44590 [Streptomyces sp. Marseille-Q5077]|uniref:hypothetical protein n=1 Tax=Streptomyces sp. Marseille-Q5077 TaxID=3418995 RepID=UPI003CFDBB7D